MKARDVAVAAGVALAFSALFVQPVSVVERLHGLSIDTLYVLRDAVMEPRYSAPESPTVIVAIDEETYRRSPFSETPKVMWSNELATVLDVVLEGGAKVVGWDVIFSQSIEGYEPAQHGGGTGDPAQVKQALRNFDLPLRQELALGARQGRVLLGFVQYSDKPILPYKGYQTAIGPGRNLHSLNIVQDADEVYRRVPLYFRARDPNDPSGQRVVLSPSMSLAMASRALGVQPSVAPDTGAVSLGDYTVPARIDDQMVIPGPDGDLTLRNDVAVRYDRGAASVPTYSLVDLAACARDGNTDYFKRHFDGKAVFFGTVLDNEDRVVSSIRYSASSENPYTPERCAIPQMAGLQASFGRDSIPGVYMQAAAVNSMIRGDVLAELPRWQGFALVLVVAGLTAALTIATGAARAAVGAALVFVAWAGAATYAFATLDVIPPLFEPMAAAALTLATLLGYRFAVTDRQGRYIRSAFQHYLAPAMVDKLVDEGRMPEQGGEMREVSVWLSDLEKYSSISEAFTPTDLVDMLNGMYSVMGDIVEEHDGFVAQYIGDAMVAVFGAPLDDADHARKAVDSAMASQRESTRYGATQTLPPGLRLHNRIGVATGQLLAGNVGSTRRLSYTVIGDDINLAARLEGTNKVYGTALLVSQATREAYGDGMVFREIDTIRVLGRDTPERIFEPVGREEEVDDARRADLARFAEGLTAYRDRRFADARAIFAELAERDPPSQTYLVRCDEMIENPPPDDWDGVFQMLSK